ncbi:hypothetical protein [Saccharicrinis fermentans]|uniref:Ribbon-helix-helix protein CopG domain-containing protein n=1 Tax=Saccharicrinis fermentans DSM 9555 = JCM 21142 TaxID=869213 RepID=W7YMU2_9BACT|nr:hypothetical protein [Saccharicrinis fermentans]GAF03719.1 hypothetical protein JCM21142_62400 [Saccharicrinis fermentans DSM 9555 = JCM 21142]
MAKKGRNKNNQPITKDRITTLRRKHRTSFMLNEKEKEAIESYCKKNKINNKSKFIRETLMRTVIQHFLDDYPTLFDKKDMDQLKV